MSRWLKTTLLYLRTALNAVRPSTTPRNIEAAIQTAARKTLSEESPKLAVSPRPIQMSHEEQMRAWQKFLEEPSPHQRLAPYA